MKNTLCKRKCVNHWVFTDYTNNLVAIAVEIHELEPDANKGKIRFTNCQSKETTYCTTFAEAQGKAELLEVSNRIYKNNFSQVLV